MSININSSINPELWGSNAWRFMHYITLSYPNNPTNTDKLNMYNFFIAVQKILPCEKCRHNFINHQKKYPLNDKSLSSKYELVNWLINVHNDVNLDAEKPTITYDEFINIYMPKEDTNININTNTIIFIIVLILILLLCLRIKHMS